MMPMLLMKGRVQVLSEADVAATKLGTDPPDTITYARCIFNVMDVVLFYEDLTTCGTYAQLRNGGLLLLQESYESIETKLLPIKPSPNEDYAT